MKRVIRNCVFETNSSSTHSISIYKWTPPPEYDIPCNSKIEINASISRTEITSEVGKLNYIVSMLANLIEYESNDYNEKFEDVISSKRFVWLKEVVKERCNTEIIYTKVYNYFPYFEATYDDCRSIADIFECDIDDENEFKERIINIVFDRDIMIEDRKEEN